MRLPMPIFFLARERRARIAHEARMLKIEEDGAKNMWQTYHDGWDDGNATAHKQGFRGNS
jgi:hypothetical protein